MTLTSDYLQINDFSGGITDFPLQGGLTHSEVLDNFLVTPDRRIEERPGSRLLDSTNYIIPGAPRRIDSFALFNGARELVAHAQRDLYLLENSWTSLVGPTGNKALTHGDKFQHLSTAEWKGHLYFTASDRCLPGKIYRDEDGQVRTLTAGLPVAKGAPKYTESTLLAACLALADDLRLKMIAHFMDTDLHENADTARGASLTDAGAPTDLESLLALCSLLRDCLQGHSDDAFLGWSSTIHANFLVYRWDDENKVWVARHRNKGPGARMRNFPEPKTLESAASFLDSLVEHYDFHRYSLYTHTDPGTTAPDPVPSAPYASRHSVTAPLIGRVSFDDSVDTHSIASFGEFGSPEYSYVSFLLETVFLPHIGGGYGGFQASDHQHKQSQIATADYPSVPKEIYDKHGLPWNFQFEVPWSSMGARLKTYIYWVLCLYKEHIADLDGAVFAPGSVSYTEDSNSATQADFLTEDFKYFSVGIPDYNNGLSPQEDKFDSNSSDISSLDKATFITDISITVLTLLKDWVDTTQAGVASQYSSSRYHELYDETKSPFPSSAGFQSYELEAGERLSEYAENLLEHRSDLPLTLSSWIDLATELYNCVLSHVANSRVHRAAPGYLGFGMTSEYDEQGVPSKTVFRPTISNYIYAMHWTHRYKTSDGVEFEVRGAPHYVGPFEGSEPVLAGSMQATGLSGKYPTHIDPQYPPFQESVSAPTEISAVDSGWFMGIGYDPEYVSGYFLPRRISGLPVLVNDDKTNYATSEVRLSLYRTTANGTVFYKIGEIENGTDEFDDYALDSSASPRSPALIGGEPLYTSGGVLAYDHPPRCRSIHLVGQKMLYLDIDEIDGGRIRSRVMQSSPGVLESAPSTLYDDLDDEGVALSSHRSIPVALCRTSAYRLEGEFDERGDGFIRHAKIEGASGCVSEGSVVQTELGIFYAGVDGFYWTDAYSAVKISGTLSRTYSSLVKSPEQASRIKGWYDAKKRHIWWGVQRFPSSGSEVDWCLVLHLDFGANKENACFSSASNGDYWRPTAGIFFQGNMIRGDSRGVVFRHTDELKTDPVIPDDVSTPISHWSDWQSAHIPYHWKSCHLDYGSLAVGQWASKIHVIGENRGNVAMQIHSINDSNLYKKRSLAPVYVKLNPTWGDAGVTWGGDTDYPHRYDRKLDAWRRFPGASVRSQVRQIEITPAYIGVYRSDEFPDGFLASSDSLSKTVTLTSPLEYDPRPAGDLSDWDLVIDESDIPGFSGVSVGEFGGGGYANLSASGFPAWVDFALQSDLSGSWLVLQSGVNSGAAYRIREPVANFLALHLIPTDPIVTDSSVTAFSIVKPKHSPWPKDVVGMKIAFDLDNYSAEYEITGVDEDILTVSDPDNSLPTGSNMKWVIRGHLKEQRVHISSIGIHFGRVGLRGEQYKGKAGRGENSDG